MSFDSSRVNSGERPQAALLRQLREIVGSAHVIPGAERRARAPAWQTHQPCNAHAVIQPGSTAEVAAVLAACNDARQAIVTYGGVTNLVQGCATTAGDLVLSLARMSAVQEIDTTAQTLTAEAGMTLRDAQSAADVSGLYYPVDIGARDNCTLGGTVSTNAGGTKVIRYGMTRDCILGLEAVLADGTVLSSMNRYIKNNSGFDLKQLFIGTEGQLGVVTRVIARLSSKPASHNVALLACDDYQGVLEVLQLSRQRLGNSLCGFEVMWQSFFAQVTEPVGRHAAPIPPRYAYYVIVEAMGNDPDRDDDTFTAAMSALFDEAHVLDGVIAKSGSERDAIWAIRHDVEWIVSGACNFDVSLRVADVAAYVADVSGAIEARWPGALVAVFGHLGDNNIHLSVPRSSIKNFDAAFVEQQVYDNLRRYQGAISAEHGIGLEKRAWLPYSRSAQEIDAMRRLKQTFDPHNILNPGKVIEIDAGA